MTLIHKQCLWRS